MGKGQKVEFVVRLCIYRHTHFYLFFQIQMERVQQYELWEKNKRREMQYIKTTVASEGQPQIFYLPKV